MQLFINLDGTLLDVSRRYYAVYSDLLRQSGFTPFDAATYWSLKRLSIEESCIVGRSTCNGFVDDYLMQHPVLLENPAYLMLDSLQPGVKQQLGSWSEQHQIILTTSRREYQPLLAQLDYFAIRNSLSEVLVSAATDRYWNNRQESIQQSLHKSRDAILICDSESGLLAARALNIRSVAISNGRRARRLLQQTQPDYLANKLEHINLEDLAALATDARYTVTNFLRA